MKVIEKYLSPELFTWETAVEIDRSGREETLREAVIREHQIDVFINEVLTMKLTCTPSYLAELVLGRMLSEGMISTAEEIEAIHICEHGRRACVFLQGYEREASPGTEKAPVCRTGNHILKDDFRNEAQVKPVIPIPWERSWIFQLIDLFQKDMPLHQKTRSAHSCYLMIDGEVIVQCEDIGRHNALDKAIGYALRHGYNLKKAIVYTTGRIPLDMISKVIRSGIPVLVSRKAPVREAILLAKECKLTLIGGAKHNTIKIFCDGSGAYDDGTGSE